MSDQEKIDLLVNWLRNMPWWEQVNASLFVDFQRELHALQLSDRIKTENIEMAEKKLDWMRASWHDDVVSMSVNDSWPTPKQEAGIRADLVDDEEKWQEDK